MKLTENARGWIWAGLGTVAVLVLVPLLLYLVHLEDVRPKYYTPWSWIHEVKEAVKAGEEVESSREAYNLAQKVESLIVHMPKKSEKAWWDIVMWPSATTELDMRRLSKQTLQPFVKCLRVKAKEYEADELIAEAGADIDQAKELPVMEAQMRTFEGLKKLDQALDNLEELSQPCQQATDTTP